MSEPAEERQGTGARRRRQRSKGGSRAALAARSQGASQGKKTLSQGKAQGAARSQGASQGKKTQGKTQGKTQSRGNGRGAQNAQRPAAGRASAQHAAATSVVPSGGAPPSAHDLVDAKNEERRRANGARLRVLAAAAGALPAAAVGALVGVVVGVVAGAVVAAVVFVGLAYAACAASLWLALRLVGGAPVPPGALAALENQVEGLCSTLGVAQPKLWLVDDPVANTCALAGRRGRSLLVVTSGLLSRLGLIEMEGVVAHELVHLKRRDAAVSALAVATAGVVAWVSGRDALVHLAVGRGREYETDQAAVLAVRYPPGLHDALASMGGQPSGQDSPFRGRRWAATRWIWIDPMLGAPERPAVGELDATTVRVDALAQW